MQRRKQTLRWMIGLFFAVLLTLTFLSNTIQGLSLPKVAVESPERGSLELAVTGEGFLRPAQTAQLYPQGDWTVETVHVGRGDRVKRGDPLVTFDTQSTERTLQDERTRYEQQRLQLEKLTEQMKLALREDDAPALDNQRRDLEMQRLDMELQQRKIADLERQIAEGRTLKAPFDGVVVSLGAAEGAAAGRGQPVVELADDASGYSFDFTANSDDASALRVGEEVKVWIEASPRRSVDGVIASIEDVSAQGNDGTSGRSKQMTIDVSGDDLEPGMKVSVSISHFSEFPGIQIPKSAIQSDSNGDYVLIVTEQDGPLGAAYYVRAAYVTIRDESENTAVVDGLMPNDRFVTGSSEPLSDGDRVRY